MSGFGDIFDLIGRGRQKSSGPRKGKPRLVETEVTLSDVYHGVVKKINIKRTRNCETCEGKGGKNVEVCTKCKGRKVVEKLVQVGPGMYTQSSQKCPECKGQGFIMKEEDRCKDCKGERIKETDKVLEVTVEPGCPNEHDYIFTGESDEYVRYAINSAWHYCWRCLCESEDQKA